MQLSIAERDALRGLVPDLTIEAVEGFSQVYELTAGARVGNVFMPELAIQVRPNIPIDRLLFMLSYSMGQIRWLAEAFDFREDDSLVEAIIPAFVAHTQAAFRPGLLQGYVVEEDALATVRGRIRFSDQVRRRFGVFPPIEVRFDEFTEDITENRLIKSAIRRLGRLRLRSDKARQSLRRFDVLLGNVTDVQYGYQLPPVEYTRLNERYRPAVELAKLILRSTSFETHHGKVRGSAFLVDMNKAFEDFVYWALRECLGLSVREFPQGARGKSLHLDERRLVRLLPDLSWWRGERCLFVGDVKYKRTNADGIEHPDLYQLLSYMIATGLQGGMLIYAAGEGESIVHQTVNIERQIRVLALDLAGPIPALLDQVQAVADEVSALVRGPSL